MRKLSITSYIKKEPYNIMENFRTEQERFWAGEFGDNYISRNDGAHIIASNIALFSKILERTDRKSVV
jgi:spore coat polysaccharide biosynthesis protein SpsF